MSDHISGPRALADPIADITDVYAFPSPETPGRLVLVVNTLPMAKPVRPLLRRAAVPLPAATARRRRTTGRLGVRRRATRRWSSTASSTRPSTCRTGDGPPGHQQHGQLRDTGGEQVSFRVNDEQGGAGRGIRVFAGVRWDPFIMDARAALATIATHKLAFTDPGSIFLDGKNVLSIVVEIDTGFLAGWTLVGVVAETLTRGEFNVRIERVGRPEVKNMMLAPEGVRPGQPGPGDPRPVQHGGRVPPRRLLRRRLPGAAGCQPRVLGRPRREVGLATRRGRPPPADRAGPRRLPGRRRHQALRRAGLVPRDRARRPARRGAPDVRGADLERRRDGHDLHPARQRRPRPHDPRRRRRRHPAGHRRVFPYLASPNPNPPEPPEHH